jgi:hypothetical protein
VEFDTNETEAKILPEKENRDMEEDRKKWLDVKTEEMNEEDKHVMNQFEEVLRKVTKVEERKEKEIEKLEKEVKLKPRTLFLGRSVSAVELWSPFRSLHVEIKQKERNLRREDENYLNFEIKRILEEQNKKAEAEEEKTDVNLLEELQSDLMDSDDLLHFCTYMERLRWRLWFFSLI